MGYGLAPPPTALTTRTALLTWLLEVLLALLNRPLALKGGGMHAGAPAIRRGTSPVAVATHGGPGLVAREPAGALLIVTDLVLDSSVAADQPVIAVAASVRHVRPVAVVAVVGLIGVVITVVVEAVAVVVVPVSIVIVVIAVPVDGVPGDVSVVVIVDVSPTTSTTPVHSPCSKAPAAAEATTNKATASAKGTPQRRQAVLGRHQ